MCRLRTFAALILAWAGLASSGVLHGSYVATSGRWIEEEQGSSLNREKRDLTSNCEPGSAVPGNRVNTTERLAGLRELMIQHDLDAYIVPLDEEGRRRWISGFSGSNGDAIVTANQAACWTDGRYFLQAANQLDCNWQLMKMGQSGVPDYTEWIVGDANLPTGGRVGADPTLIGAETWLDMRKDIEAEGLELVSLEANLIDEIYTVENGRPEFKPKNIVVHPLQFAGQPWEEKVAHLRASLAKSNHSAMLVSELDEIAWLFNLRGEGASNVEGLFNSPLFQSLALVSLDEILLWIHTSQLTPDLLSHLQAVDCEATLTCVVLQDLNRSTEDLRQWATSHEGLVLLAKPSTYLGGASFALYEALPQGRAVLGESSLLRAKDVKNQVEVAGMISSHVRDAYAVCEFASILQAGIESGSRDWTEISAAAELSRIRSQQDLSRGDSFGAISAFGPNSAIIHYSPEPKTDARLDNSSVFLVDSGGQYLDGTTDVTRTFHFGQPTNEMREMYTRVLRGKISLASLIIPENTKQNAVDLAARQYLFEKGTNFRHGTGHGIGSYLCVHEGPLNINMAGSSEPKLRANQFFSDEPGYYKDGEFGIRLESIVRVVQKEFDDDTYGAFISLETITLVPFEPKLIDFAQMHPDQIQWLNDYNARIRETIGGHFEEIGRQDVVDWIKSKTEYVNPGTSGLVREWSNSEL